MKLFDLLKSLATNSRSLVEEQTNLGRRFVMLAKSLLIRVESSVPEVGKLVLLREVSLTLSVKPTILVGKRWWRCRETDERVKCPKHAHSEPSHRRWDE